MVTGKDRMKTLIERASSGNRQAVTELYDKYWKGVKAICSGCLGDTDAANEAVVQAFRSTWDYLLNKSIKSEDEFQTILHKQAAMLCRRNFVKKGMKGLPIPQNKNFLVMKWKKEYSEGATAMDNLLNMLPDLNRYLFVLHQIAEIDEKMIRSITGYKNDVIMVAWTAEVQNIEKALELIYKKTGLRVDLEKEILRYRETVHLPEKYHKQILAEIDLLVKPYEKKLVQRIVLYSACVVGAVVIIGAFIAAYNKEETEITFSTGTASQEDSTSEGTANSDENETNAVVGESMETSEEDSITISDGQAYYADIEIEGYGTVTIELDHETAPITVENFVSLAEEDFYDGLTFHRIMDGFMMQGGDPNGDGTGGAEENIVGEFSNNGYENELSHTRGVVSMARSSAYDSASSQFFIVHEDSTFLDGQYAAFGWVTEGMDIVDAICTEAEPTDDNGTIPTDKQPVITSIEIRIESTEQAEE